MQAKSNHVPETIKVQSDNGSLRLQFSTDYNPVFGGNRKHKGLGMKDTPENWQKALAIAWRIEEDLQHSDWEKLFDPTFAKYGLKTKYGAAKLELAKAIPEPEPEMTVGAMWEDYLVWKQPQLQPTTFEFHFKTAMTSVIKGMVWDRRVSAYTQTEYSVWNLPVSPTASEVLRNMPVASESIKRTFQSLSEAFTRLQSLGRTKLTANPFAAQQGTGENKTDKYKPRAKADGTIDFRWWQTDDNETDSDERDRRTFTKDERDIIVQAFYSHKNPGPRQVASLVEFRFLTGCRNGEAFALEWRDVFLGKERNFIRFEKSYNGRHKNTQVTKTGETRIFKIYPKLNDLLLRIKPTDAKPTDLVFTKLNGKSWDNTSLGELWNGWSKTRKGIKHTYPGVVTQLADDGLIGGYLPFYNCRHTFISLQAHAGTDLFLLATACGNSVEVIQRHYLGVDESVVLTDI